MEENEPNTEIVNSEEAIPSLKEGYDNVNIPDAVKFFQSNQTVSDYLKEQIIIHFADKEFSFIEERDEFKPTDYLKNSRPLKVFVIKDSTKIEHVFVFDVAGCLI